jgi:hypothetical protein
VQRRKAQDYGEPDGGRVGGPEEAEHADDRGNRGDAKSPVPEQVQAQQRRGRPALRHVSAKRERKPIVPFTRARPFLGAGTAYEAQSLFVGHRLQNGERVIGAKLGMTSKVKRDALGIHEPV